MSVYMETTHISADKTASEIQQLLGSAGATAVQINYRDRKVEALSFLLAVKDRPIPFRLPVRTERMFAYLQNRRSPRVRTRKRDVDLEQAERVAWRQILRWVQAQIALSATGMVKMEEVFLPYVQVGIGQTFYDRLEAGNFKALPSHTEE
jgi:hypothetical protein